MGLLDVIIEIVTDMAASIGFGRRAHGWERRERGSGLRRLTGRTRRRA